MTVEQAVSQPKIGKGQFKCFQCREVYAMKDGDWYTWKTMEVHLCRECEKETRDRPERKAKGK